MFLQRAILSRPPVIGVLLIIQVPDPNDKGHMSALSYPINRFLQSSKRGEDLVSVIFYDIIVDRITFWAPLRSSLNIDVCHVFVGTLRGTYFIGEVMIAENRRKKLGGLG